MFRTAGVRTVLLLVYAQMMCVCLLFDSSLCCARRQILISLTCTIHIYITFKFAQSKRCSHKIQYLCCVHEHDNNVWIWICVGTLQSTRCINFAYFSLYCVLFSSTKWFSYPAHAVKNCVYIEFYLSRSKGFNVRRIRNGTFWVWKCKENYISWKIHSEMPKKLNVNLQKYIGLTEYFIDLPCLATIIERDDQPSLIRSYFCLLFSPLPRRYPF